MVHRSYGMRWGCCSYYLEPILCEHIPCVSFLQAFSFQQRLQEPRDAIDDDALFTVVGAIFPAAHLERRFGAHYARKLLDSDQKAAYNHSAVDAMTRPLTLRENSAPYRDRTENDAG